MTSPGFVRSMAAAEFAVKYRKERGCTGLGEELYNEGHRQGEIEAFAMVAGFLRQEKRPEFESTVKWLDGLVENRKQFGTKLAAKTSTDETFDAMDVPDVSLIPKEACIVGRQGPNGHDVVTIKLELPEDPAITSNESQIYVKLKPGTAEEFMKKYFDGIPLGVVVRLPETMPPFTPEV
jgi:hypothetical protein